MGANETGYGGAAGGGGSSSSTAQPEQSYTRTEKIAYNEKNRNLDVLGASGAGGANGGNYHQQGPQHLYGADLDSSTRRSIADSAKFPMYQSVAAGIAQPDQGMVHELLEEVWSLETALRYSESRVTHLLVNEERLGLVEEMDDHLKEVKQEKHNMKVKIADLGTQCSKLVKDIGKCEAENKKLYEKIHV